eukprot:6209245-Pleurochrysis_carterae.AAC.3
MVRADAAVAGGWPLQKRCVAAIRVRGCSAPRLRTLSRSSAASVALVARTALVCLARSARLRGRSHAGDAARATRRHAMLCSHPLHILTYNCRYRHIRIA